MTGAGQVSIASNMSAIAIASCSLPSRVEGHRGAHPGEVGAGTERRSVAGEDDRPESGRLLAREHRERRPQLRDQRRVEGVVDLRARQRDPGDGVGRTGALEADAGTHRDIVAAERQHPHPAERPHPADAFAYAWPSTLP